MEENNLFLLLFYIVLKSISHFASSGLSVLFLLFYTNLNTYKIIGRELFCVFFLYIERYVML